jgi:tRNA pseudouridine38-40 synthase
MLQRYKLTIAYDGTMFCGWQRQPEPVRTVQRVVEIAAGQIVNHPVTVHGSSRTDTGVHAEGQVAQMDADTNLEPRRLRMAINSRMPSDAIVRELEPVDMSFDASDAVRKRYRYVIWAAADRPIFNRQFMYHYCQHFIGTHDFVAFRGSGDQRENTIRTIFACDIRAEPYPSRAITFGIEGSGFMYHMVRNIVGTLIEVGRGHWPPHRIPEIIASRDRQQAGCCAPAQGLCLEWIQF